MKKRILLILLTLVLAVALVIPMAIPVAAYSATSLVLQVVPGGGYEIFAGIVSGGNRYGATFIAQVAGTDSNGAAYSGALTTSVNYQGTAPTPGGRNYLIGGSWSLTLVQKGKTVGTIIGKVDNTGGYVDWSPPGTTDYGHVFAPVTFTGISKTFAATSGKGSFDGQDVHASGVYLFGIEVPTVNGKLSLTFNN